MILEINEEQRLILRDLIEEEENERKRLESFIVHLLRKK